MCVYSLIKAVCKFLAPFYVVMVYVCGSTKLFFISQTTRYSERKLLIINLDFPFLIQVISETLLLLTKILRDVINVPLTYIH
jgi:hypothetical protein